MSNLSRSAVIRPKVSYIRLSGRSLYECASILARQALKNKSKYMITGNEELNENFSTHSRLES